MKTIEIPDDIYAELEKRAIPFQDKEPADVIRRHLKSTSPQAPAQIQAPMSNSGSSQDLVTQGGRIPHGKKLRCKYKGRQFEATVLNSRIHIDNQSFASPAAAAHRVARLMGNSRPSINGWTFWKYLDEKSGNWHELSLLRKEQ